MNKWMALLLVGIMSLSMVGCTENQRVRAYGGTMKVELPKGKKVLNATWKQDNLWYVTRDARPGELPEVVEFIESSNLGLADGKIIFIER